MERKVSLTKLKELRKSKKLTQKNVAKILGYKSSLGYHYIEMGRCRLKAEQIAILSKLYGVSIEYLFDNNNIVEEPNNEHRYCTNNSIY